MTEYYDEVSPRYLRVYSVELLLVALVLLAPPGVVDLSDLERRASLLGEPVMTQLDPGVEQTHPGQLTDHLVTGRERALLWRVIVGDGALLGSVVTVT